MHTLDLPLQTRRRANLRHLIKILDGEGLVTRAVQADILGNVSARALQDVLEGAEIGDAMAREFEWAMLRPVGWLDMPRGDALDD